MPTVPDIHRRGTRADQDTLAAPPLTVGTLYFVTDEGVTERWDGSAWETYSGAGTGITPPPTPGATPSTFLVAGGQVAWESSYTFRVSAASYYINQQALTSLEQTATLAAAHATLDRLDVVALDTSGTVVVIAGTPSATPSEPSVDPAAYLKLAIVLVTHATSTPPTLTQVTVYRENLSTPTEWAWTASGAAIVVSSLNTPHAGTTTIEGTNVPAGVYAQGTAAAAIDPTGYDHLLLFLRSKAAWNSSRGLLVTLRTAGVLVGAAVQIRRTGTFGFDSTLTTDYQQIAIPITAFAVPQGTLVDQVRIEDFGGAIGFFVDDISFQVGATTGGGVSGITQEQADARYAPLVHATRHQAGGADPLALDTLAAPTDVTTLNATASAHGLLRKLSGTATDYLDGTGAWSVPGGGGGAPAAHHLTHETGGTDAIVALSGAVITSGTVAAARLGTHASTHDTGGSDPITALAGSVITTGTIAAARLPARTTALGIVIDGGGSAITTGVKGFLEVPAACTITGWTLLSTDTAATAGSIVIDVWKDTYATYPPTIADTITASAKPTLSSVNKNTSTTLTGWTTALAAGDILGFSVDSATTVTKVLLALRVSVP